MKRSKLCFGLLSVFLIIFGLSLNVSSDVNASSHDYLGIPFMGPCLRPSSDFTSLVPYPSEHPNCDGFGSNLSITFSGTAFDSSLSDIYVNSSSSWLGWAFEDNSFYYDSSYDLLHPLFSRTNSDNSVSISSTFRLNFTVPEFLSNSSPGSSANFRSRTPFGSSGKPPFVFKSTSILICGTTFGAVCGGLWNTNEYISSQILPYWYSADGFYRVNSAIDTDSGAHYSYAFSFDDLFNKPIRSFSELKIPLHDYGGYFWNSSNLTSGRAFEFKGAFEFDGSFEWNSNVGNSNFGFQIRALAQEIGDRDGVKEITFSDCTTNLITLSSTGYKQLEFSCFGNLSHDYLYFLPFLDIYGGSEYVFKTDDTWRFASMFLVTDNDDTPGTPFNSELTGGGTIIGSDEYILSQNAGSEDWFSSLTSLFSFDFINPFAPIFNLFNNDSCANIPTLAGLLHSEETQVCPWFDSSIRNITTPVLGLASMMLVFGFVVRWLGSRSGNFIEDSEGVDVGSYHLGNKFRRKK